MNKEKIRSISFYILWFLFCLGFSLHKNMLDYDLWARLLQGKAFWTLGHILKTDPFSFTFTHEWLDHEWGASVIFYAFFDAFGPIGFILLKNILIFLIFFLLLQTVKLAKPKYSGIYNILFCYCTLQAMIHVLAPTVRCHLFTFLFFTLFLFILQKVRLENNNRLLVLLPILMIFWANIHGGCVSGIGLLGLFAVGEFLNKKPFKKYLITLIPTCIVTFINPYGWEYVKFLIHATTMPRPYISEWQNTFFGPSTHLWWKFKTFYFIFMAVFAAYIGKTIRTKQAIDFTKCILIITMAFLSFRHVKHQPFFVITAAILLYDDFYWIFNGLMKKIQQFFNITAKFVSNFVIIKEISLSAIIILFAISSIWIKPVVFDITKSAYPYYHIEFLRKNNMMGTLLCNFHFGSYAAYKLFPYNLIYMDGRYEEVYYDKSILLLRDYYRGAKNFDKILELRPNYIIVEKNSFAFEPLKKYRKDYTLVSEKDNFALFVQKNIAKAKYIEPQTDPKYYQKTMFDSQVNYFQHININGRDIKFE